MADRPSSPQRAFAALLDDVAARTPAPGGGSSSAWAGALAAALTEMAASFGPPDAPRMPEIAERARALRDELLGLGETELTAFDPVLEALRLPRDDPSRAARIASASATAASSPLQIARAAAELAELATEVASTGNPNLIGDAMTGALLAEAVCQAAVELARINLAGQAGDPRLVEGEELLRRAAVAR